MPMKRNMRVLCIAIISLILVISNSFAFAQNNSKDNINGSKYPSVLLKSNGVCLSGFLTKDNKIITAAHGTHSCVKNDCSNFDIFYNNEKILYSNLKISKISYTLDIAILDMELDENSRNLLDNAIDISTYNDKNISSKIKILGFPKCEKFTEDNATIVSGNNLLLQTSSKSNFGSSGSLVLSSDDKFIGMAIKATNVTSAIKSLITGSTLNANVIKGNLISDIDKIENSEILPYEINALNKYYDENIYNNFTQTRYPLTFSFMLMINNMISNLPLYEVSDGSYIKTILESNFNAPFILSNIEYKRDLTNDEEAAEKLSFKYSFEKVGFLNKNFKAINEISLKEALNINQRSKEHLDNLNFLISNAKKHNQYSYAMSYIVTLVWFLSLIFLYIFVLFFISGIYFTKFSGSIKKRFFKVIIFMITFPISLIVCKLKKQKK